jgi:hypothetical protein
MTMPRGGFGTGWVEYQYVSPGPDLSGSVTATAVAGAVARPAEPADVALAQAVAANLAAQSNPSPAARYDNALLVPGGRALVPGASAALLVQASRAGEGVSAPPDSLARRTVPAPERVGAVEAPIAPDEQADEPPARHKADLPQPRLSGVLSALPPVDLSGLEAGMRQFLDHLGRAGKELGQSPEGMALYLWLTVGAAAAVACEIARRQSTRPAAAPAGEMDGSPGFPPRGLPPG